MTFCEMYKNSKSSCDGCPNRYACTDSPLKSKVTKIFYGSETFDVVSKAEAYEVMVNIARKASGTLGSTPVKETGFFVDERNPISIGAGMCLYTIKGSLDSKPYAETNNRNLFL